MLSRQKADHSAKMIVMPVAQHERIEGRGIDLEDRHVVRGAFRRITEMNQHIALLAVAERLRVHRQAPFAIERPARRRVGGGVAADPALDGEAVALVRGNELNHHVVGDDADREAVDLRRQAPSGGPARSVHLRPSRRQSQYTKPAPPALSGPNVDQKRRVRKAIAGTEKHPGLPRRLRMVDP